MLKNRHRLRRREREESCAQADHEDSAPEFRDHFEKPPRPQIRRLILN
jgi:hypothetical protein